MVIHEKVYGNKKNYTKWNDGCRLMNRNNGKSKTIRFR